MAYKLLRAACVPRLFDEILSAQIRRSKPVLVCFATILLKTLHPDQSGSRGLPGGTLESFGLIQLADASCAEIPACFSLVVRDRNVGRTFARTQLLLTLFLCLTVEPGKQGFERVIGKPQ